MISLPAWQRSAAASLRLLGALTLCCTLPLLLLAAGPAWWTERTVLIPNTEANDFAAINQGQLKRFALAAFEELQAKLPPPGAGPAVSTLIEGWTQLDANNQRVPNPSATTADYAAVNVGQLKAVAKPFYDRLIATGHASQYPWTAAATDDNDYALANIGQAKRVFAFEINLPLEAPGAAITLQEDTAAPIVLQSNGGGGEDYSIVTAPLHGTVEITGASATYYPNAHYNGTDSLQLSVPGYQRRRTSGSRCQSHHHTGQRCTSG